MYVWAKKNMRIAHISDLHISFSHKKSNIGNTKQLLKYIVENNFDHIVITGDITDNALPKDYEIIRGLLEKLGLLDGKRISVVIGNHDIFGGVQKPEDIFSFPSKCGKTNYNEKIKLFREYFIEAFWNTYNPIKNEPFPFIKDLGEVVLIGLNSIDHYSKIKNPFASNGRISRKHYEVLEEIFAMKEYKTKIKILLLHHHFYKEPMCNSNPNLSLLERIEKQTMKLRGKKRLLNMLGENNVKLVLHGHLHESCEYYKKKIHFVNAGASIDSKDNDIMNINEINIEQDKVTVELKSINKIKSLSTNILYSIPALLPQAEVINS